MEYVLLMMPDDPELMPSALTPQNLYGAQNKPLTLFISVSGFVVTGDTGLIMAKALPAAS